MRGVCVFVSYRLVGTTSWRFRLPTNGSLTLKAALLKLKTKVEVAEVKTSGRSHLAKYVCWNKMGEPASGPGVVLLFFLPLFPQLPPFGCEEHAQFFPDWQSLSTYMWGKDAMDERIFTGAHQTWTPKGSDKIDFFLNMLKYVWKDIDELAAWADACQSMERFAERLKVYPAIGPFLSHEIACDLRYESVVWPEPPADRLYGMSTEHP